MNVPVSEGTRVFLNFSVSLEDGSEVDSNFGGDPVDFVVGDGSLLPGFERLIFGMAAGDRQMFTVSPEDAFGQPNDNNVQYLPRDQFDEEAELEIGTVYSFADASGGELPGMIISFVGSRPLPHGTEMRHRYFRAITPRPFLHARR